VRLIRACREALIASKGSIVMVGSVNGVAAYGEPAYAAAKAGLTLLAKNLAVELGPAGVRINVVAPGTVRTRVWDHQGGPDALAPLYPLGRVGEPADIAAAIAFLASDDASWITGVTLPVDGGSLAGPLATMSRLLPS
jgi:NAD(P)-dependent dehydrogenase (short-subunit alcohol dehydrogenase family)